MNTSIKKYVIIVCLFTVGLQKTMYVKSAAVEQATSLVVGRGFLTGLCASGFFMSVLVGELASAKQTKAATEVELLKLSNQNTTAAEAKVNFYQNISSAYSFFGMVVFATGWMGLIYPK